MLKSLLQKSLIHSSENVDLVVLESYTTEIVAWFFHLSTLLPLYFFELAWIFNTHISKSILADFHWFQPLISVSIVATNYIDIFVSNVYSSMTYTAGD